jgi:ferritin-like metal-binding protein YciE
MAKAAQSKDLKAAFEKHRGEAERQVKRLEQVSAQAMERYEISHYGTLRA